MLTLYKPFADLFRDDFFTRGWEPTFGAGLARERQGFTPAVDVVENDTEFLVRAELAGVKPEEIEVEVREGVLTLKGERKQEHEETQDGYRRIERAYGQFQRSFTLPKGTNPDAVEAGVENGVLTVHVPKPVAKEEAAPRKVAVKGEGFMAKAKKAVAKAIESPGATS